MNFHNIPIVREASRIVLVLGICQFTCGWNGHVQTPLKGGGEGGKRAWEREMAMFSLSLL